jgi:hypothetical protein
LLQSEVFTSTNLYNQQYQFVQCIKINDTQIPALNNDMILCKVPLDVLAPKLTLKSVKNICKLHNLFMPSRILLKNAQISLQDHKCQCSEFLSVFKPHKRDSNAEYQLGGVGQCFTWHVQVPSFCNLFIFNISMNMTREYL